MNALQYNFGSIVTDGQFGMCAGALPSAPSIHTYDFRTNHYFSAANHGYLAITKYSQACTALTSTYKERTLSLYDLL